MRGLLGCLLALALGCAQVADLRNDPALIEDGGEPPACLNQAGAPAVCAYAACEGNDDCAAGTFCDLDWKTCKPICTGDGDCGSGRCLPATNGGEPLPSGLKTCAAMCDPVQGTLCGEAAACWLRASGPPALWDCTGSIGLAFGETGCGNAAGAAPCSHGHACVADRCEKCCFRNDPLPAQCQSACVVSDPSAVFDGKQVGTCR